MSLANTEIENKTSTLRIVARGVKLDEEAVRAANRIEDVIPALLGVSLSASNGSLEPVVRCPFHEDKHPSLRVNLDKQVWYCDPCNIGSDVFGFVQKYRSCDFPSALRFLAERAGIASPAQAPTAASSPRLATSHGPVQRGQIVRKYDYHDEHGTRLYQVCRYEPKGFSQRRPDGKGGWIKNMQGVRLVLYRLPQLKTRKAVVIVAGEKDADALWALTVPATTNSGGENHWTAAHTTQLVEAGVERVFIIPDNDDAGREHGHIVAQSCQAAGLAVHLLDLPGLPPKGDVSDYLATHTKDELVALIEAAPVYLPKPAAAVDAAAPSVDASAAVGVQGLDEPTSELPPPNDGAPEPGGTKKESAATTLVRLAQEANVELFHTPSRDPYISIPVNGHVETYALKSKAVRDWLARLFWDQMKRTPNGNAVQDARQTLAGMACFDGPEHDVALRVARGPNAVYLDLGDDTWSAVKITAEGWSVVSDPPVRFRRPGGMLSLPVPQKGGDLQQLRQFVNLASDEDFILATAWELGALRPSGESCGAYPVLNVTGESGSAKSTAATVLRRLIDPVDAPLRAAPREERDLMIAALNGHVVSFDNVSKLPDAISDVLCRLASGTALSCRQLYSDDEETILKAHRPIILNGIADVVTRGDLLDRAISITLPTIPDERRLCELRFWEHFKREHPFMLGALLDAVSMALARDGKVEIDRPPRLADFATWVASAEPACPWTEGAFLAAYRGSQEAAIEGSLEGNPVADVVRGLPPDWAGTSTELLAKMNEGAQEAARRRPDWPKTPRALSVELRRRATSLRKLGIDILFPEGKGRGQGRVLTILRTPQPAGTQKKDAKDANPVQPAVCVLPETREFGPVSVKEDAKDARDAKNPAKFPMTREQAIDPAAGFEEIA